jgi:sugar lactone lactonase YvrE
MRTLVILRLVILAVSLSFLGDASAIDRAHYRELGRQARKFGEQKDWAGLKRTLVEIGRELPADTPRQMLAMASVEMHLGNKAEAHKWMEKYVATGLSYDVASDEDLAALDKDSDFQAIKERLRKNSAAIDKAELVCTLPIPDMTPEDLTYDASKKAFFMSSVHHHTIYRVSLPKKEGQRCTASEVPLSDALKHWPTLAISWDDHRKLLWVTASAMPGFKGLSKQDEGKAALMAIDAGSGKLLRRLDLASDAPAVLGDMSIASDGAVYVTDSLGGGVYRVSPGELAQSKLEKIADGLFSPQTPVATSDSTRLMVADYSMGIAVVHLPAKDSDTPAKIEYLKHPDNVAVTGIDGLFLDGSDLIGIQNGVEPERILRFRLNKAQTEIMSAEVIEQKTERLGEATHVVRVGDWYYVIANVGWDRVGDDGELQPGKQFTAPALLRFRAH